MEEETRRRLVSEKNSGKNYNQIRKIILSEIQDKSSYIDYKSIIIRLCGGKEERFFPLLERYYLISEHAELGERRLALRRWIKYLYDFGNEFFYEDVHGEPDYIINRENCYKHAEMLHAFLCTYYDVGEQFDPEIVPIGDYIRISDQICQNGNLFLNKKYRLYLKRSDGKQKYYILDFQSSDHPEFLQLDLGEVFQNRKEKLGNLCLLTLSEQLTDKDGTGHIHVYFLPDNPFTLLERKKEPEQSLPQMASTAKLFITRLNETEITVPLVNEEKNRLKNIQKKEELMELIEICGMTYDELIYLIKNQMLAQGSQINRNI